MVFLTAEPLGGGTVTLAVTFSVALAFAQRVAKIKLLLWLSAVDPLSSFEKMCRH